MHIYFLVCYVIFRKKKTALLYYIVFFFKALCINLLMNQYTNEDEEEHEETYWKYIHGDVFRFKLYTMNEKGKLISTCHIG
jgi:hypothetical protein